MSGPMVALAVTAAVAVGIAFAVGVLLGETAARLPIP